MDDPSSRESRGKVAVLRHDTDGWIAGSAHVRAGDGGRGINTRQDTKRRGSVMWSLADEIIAALVWHNFGHGFRSD